MWPSEATKRSDAIGSLCLTPLSILNQSDVSASTRTQLNVSVYTVQGTLEFDDLGLEAPSTKWCHSASLSVDPQVDVCYPQRLFILAAGLEEIV